MNTQPRLRLRRKVRLGGIVLGLALGALACKAQFINGGFESNNFSGWERGSGYWGGGAIDPSSYFSGGGNYFAGADASAIVSPGTDPNTGGNLNMVYSGSHSVRINDQVNNYTVSAIRQTVTNYSDDHIFFAWAAVLEDSHGVSDSDNFVLTLTNDTQGLTLYSVTYNSANTDSLFDTYFDANTFRTWYYTDWQVQDLDVSAYKGDTFTLTLLASDCPYGGHAGYVYLDGFGSVIPPQEPPGMTPVPEPSTYAAFAALGLIGAVALRRRRQAKAAAAA